MSKSEDPSLTEAEEWRNCHEIYLYADLMSNYCYYLTISIALSLQPLSKGSLTQTNADIKAQRETPFPFNLIIILSPSYIKLCPHKESYIER